MNIISALFLLAILAATQSPVRAGMGAPSGAERFTAEAVDFEIYPGIEKSKPSNTDPAGGQRSSGSGTGLTVYNTLTGVTAIQTGGSVGSSSGASYFFRNLRIASAQTTLNDYIIGTYTPDLVSQRLVPSSFRKYAGVGLYGQKEALLLKDNTAVPGFYTNPATPNQYPHNTWHTWQSGTAYKANLTSAQSLDLLITGIQAGRTVRMIITDPCNEVVADNRVAWPTSNYYLIQPRRTVLLTGAYQFTVEPVSPSSAFSYQISFWNANAQTTTTVVSGNTLTASLGGFGSDYKKYKVSLNSGQTISCPGDDDTNLALINSRSEVLASDTNAGIIQTVTEAGDYYIVIYPRDYADSSNATYSGVMTITNSVSYLDWSWLYRLRNDRDAAGEDADGDGMSNLMEYALDSNPDDAGERGAVIASVPGADLRLTFVAPGYVQGVTYAAEFSSNGTSWSTATLTSVGAVPGGTLMQASVPRASGRRLGRLRVAAVE